MKFYEGHRWRKYSKKGICFVLPIFPLFSSIIIFLIIINALSPIHSAFSHSGFTHSDYPPLPPELSTKDNSLVTVDYNEKLSLPPLKAVLLVGPIDGNTGTWTMREIANMELAAQVLNDHGVEVHKFYPGTGTFAEIEAAADGAHFLLYRGHGVYDGKIPNPTVGGFYLSSGYYSPDRIKTNLHLAPNAIVMLYGCFTAGSSSAPGDELDIGITEASRRVAQYSAPFFHAGASGYYANWFGNAFESFLNYLFAGQTLGQSYESYFDFNNQTVYRTVHPDFPTLQMWVDKDNWEYWKYNNAFVGLADKTLMDLFKSPELGGIPENIRFFYSIPDQQWMNSTFDLNLANTGNDYVIEWEADTSEAWILISPEIGQTPTTLTVSVNGFDLNIPGVYEGTITIRASIESEPVGNTPIAIPVTLTVSDGHISRIYLPILHK
jgi:hypothetical protein